MLNTTTAILASLEQVTGFRAHVEADRSLAVMSTVRMATTEVPVHLIRFKPSLTAIQDYLICFQCGFVLRLFALPAEKRLDMIASYRGRKEVDRLLIDHLRSTGQQYPRDVRDALRDRLHDGLMLQLRSVPQGLRIDEWLWDEHEPLRDQQRQGAEMQLRDNLRSLAPEVIKIAPPIIRDANHAMNAAFAAFWATRLEQPEHIAPYAILGARLLSQQLLASLEQTPKLPEQDWSLIDAWAGILSVRGWYELKTRNA